MRVAVQRRHPPSNEALLFVELGSGRSDCVCRVRTSLPERLLLSARRIFLCLSLELSVDLRSQDDDVAAQIEPHEQNDDATQRTVRFAVAAPVTNVQREQRTPDQP